MSEIGVDMREARRQSYANEDAARRAARRALRWMRRARAMERPPTHIAQKLRLLSSRDG